MLPTGSQYFDLGVRLLRGQPSGQALIRYQSERLRRLVRHAYECVPYYRNLFDRHRLRPEHIRGVEDLAKIPISSRLEIQAQPPDQIVVRGIDPESLEVHRTAGSSGVPFAVRRTLAEDRYLFAIRLRAFHKLGWRPSDRWANIGSIKPSQVRSGFVHNLFKRFGSFRPRGFECTGPLEPLIARLREYRPEVITGYPNVLSRLAQMLTDDDRRWIRPRFVVSESEVMTPVMREYIHRGFSAPVYQFYATWEFNVLGWECPSSGEMHTSADTVLIEVLAKGDPVPEGGRGEVVCTGLHSYAMPLLRYRLGDVVTRGREACACGKPYATIRAIQGRMLDYFPLPDGRMIHPYEISAKFIFPDVPLVRQYQLLQERKDRVVLRMVPAPTATAEMMTTLRSRLAELLGPQVTVDILTVDSIAPDATGKYRVARSLVHSMYDEGSTR
jgi:phenylacetate-CoA ligase